MHTGIFRLWRKSHSLLDDPRNNLDLSSLQWLESPFGLNELRYAAYPDGIRNILLYDPIQKVSEYDQEITRTYTANRQTAPREEPQNNNSQKTKWKQLKQPAFSSPSRWLQN